MLRINQSNDDHVSEQMHSEVSDPSLSPQLYTWLRRLCSLYRLPQPYGAAVPSFSGFVSHDTAAKYGWVSQVWVPGAPDFSFAQRYPALKQELRASDCIGLLRLMTNWHLYYHPSGITED
jgi:hypothetical protein